MLIVDCCYSARLIVQHLIFFAIVIGTIRTIRVTFVSVFIIPKYIKVKKCMDVGWISKYTSGLDVISLSKAHFELVGAVQSGEFVQH